MKIPVYSGEKGPEFKLILSVHGTIFSLHSVEAELSFAYTQYKLNLVPLILSIS